MSLSEVKSTCKPLVELEDDLPGLKAGKGGGLWQVGTSLWVKGFASLRV